GADCEPRHRVLEKRSHVSLHPMFDRGRAGPLSLPAPTGAPSTVSIVRCFSRSVLRVGGRGGGTPRRTPGQEEPDASARAGDPGRRGGGAVCRVLPPRP